MHTKNPLEMDVDYRDGWILLVISLLLESAIAIAPRERFWQGPVCPVLPSSTFHLGGPLDFHEG